MKPRIDRVRKGCRGCGGRHAWPGALHLLERPGSEAARAREDARFTDQRVRPLHRHALEGRARQRRDRHEQNCGNAHRRSHPDHESRPRHDHVLGGTARSASAWGPIGDSWQRSSSLRRADLTCLAKNVRDASGRHANQRATETISACQRPSGSVRRRASTTMSVGRWPETTPGSPRRRANLGRASPSHR